MGSIKKESEQNEPLVLIQGGKARTISMEEAQEMANNEPVDDTQLRDALKAAFTPPSVDDLYDHFIDYNASCVSKALKPDASEELKILNDQNFEMQKRLYNTQTIQAIAAKLSPEESTAFLAKMNTNPDTDLV
jgi:hypothetical protein